MATKKHPGFSSLQKQISREEDVPMKNAGAILAKKTREASPQARRENPALHKVRGGRK